MEMADEQAINGSESAAWLALRDAAYVGRLMPLLRLAVKLYFRSDVQGLRGSRRRRASGIQPLRRTRSQWTSRWLLSPSTTTSAPSAPSTFSPMTGC